MTDIIYDRGTARESIIWSPFLFNGPFTALQTEERVILFGLYSSVYLHGYAYLQAIETEELEAIVTKYTDNMAKLTGEEAQLALDIAAKRYLDRIDGLIQDA